MDYSKLKHTFPWSNLPSHQESIHCLPPSILPTSFRHKHILHLSVYISFPILHYKNIEERNTPDFILYVSWYACLLNILYIFIKY